MTPLFKLSPQEPEDRSPPAGPLADHAHDRAGRLMRAVPWMLAALIAGVGLTFTGAMGWESHGWAALVGCTLTGAVIGSFCGAHAEIDAAEEAARKGGKS